MRANEVRMSFEDLTEPTISRCRRYPRFVKLNGRVLSREDMPYMGVREKGIGDKKVIIITTVGAEYKLWFKYAFNYKRAKKILEDSWFIHGNVINFETLH